jgi:hypothetical protein
MFQDKKIIKKIEAITVNKNIIITITNIYVVFINGIKILLDTF